MADIKETKEMVSFVVCLAEGAALSLEDGKLTPLDFAHFVEALTKAPAAFSGVATIPSELTDLSQEELEELKTQITEEFDIPQDEIEAVIEKALSIGVQIADLIQDIRDLDINWKMPVFGLK